MFYLSAIVAITGVVGYQYFVKRVPVSLNPIVSVIAMYVVVLVLGAILLLLFPAEGGFLYNLGRRFTSKRYMEKKYGIDYDALVHHEHCNEYKIIANELAKKFNIKRRFFIPFPFLPIYHANAIVCFSSINNC